MRCNALRFDFTLPGIAGKAFSPAIFAAFYKRFRLNPVIYGWNKYCLLQSAAYSLAPHQLVADSKSPGEKFMFTLQAIQSQKTVTLPKLTPTTSERQLVNQASAFSDKVTISAEANNMQNMSTRRLTEGSVDFRNMTRQQMRDWVNEKIISGEMSLDESTPFVGMTLKVSTENMQPADIYDEKESINFFENASLGIDGAISRGDRKEAAFLQKALAIMQKFQGRIVL